MKGKARDRQPWSRMEEEKEKEMKKERRKKRKGKKKRKNDKRNKPGHMVFVYSAYGCMRLSATRT